MVCQSGQAFVSEVNCFLRDGISHSASLTKPGDSTVVYILSSSPRPQQGQPTLAYTPNVKKKHYKKYIYTHLRCAMILGRTRSIESLKLFVQTAAFTGHLYRNSEDARTSTLVWGTGRQSCNSWETHRSRPIASWQVFRLQNVIWHWNKTTPWYMLEKWCDFIGRAGGVRCEQPDWRLGFSLVWWILFCVFAFTRH